MEILEVNTSPKCDAGQKRTKAEKVAAIADKALQKLSEGVSAHEVANYIRGQSIDCFSVEAQSERRDDILASMKKSVCTKDKKSRGVTLDTLKKVADNLGKTIDDKCK